jgi:type IV pilus assembly protein PilB
LDQKLAEESGLAHMQIKGISVYQPRGCPECHGTGYHGRQCITEFLELTDPIKEMILARKAPSEIRHWAVSEGMTSLREAAMEKAFEGVTSLKEINRVTFTDPASDN